MIKLTAVTGLLVLAGATSALAATSDRVVEVDDPWTAAAAADTITAQQQWDDVGELSLRVWGDTRYETAAAVSDLWEPEEVDIVFLATGADFPDALAISASTFLAGPVLLVGPTSLPEATRAELERLEPCLVVAVGGPAVIADEVIEEADTYAEECDFEL